MPGQKQNSGGKKGRSGRKSKAEELGLQALLDKCWTPADREKCIRALAKTANSALSSDRMDAIKLLMGYTFGKPVEHKQISGEGGEALKVIVEYVGRSENT